MRAVFCTLAAVEQLNTCWSRPCCEWFFVPISCRSWPLLGAIPWCPIKVGLQLALYLVAVRLHWISCLALRSFWGIAAFVNILVFSRFWTSPIDLLCAWVLNHVNLAVWVRLIRTSLVVFFYLWYLVLNVIERKHVASGLVFGRWWMSETLTCLRLRLYVHNLFLVHKLIVIGICDIKIWMIVVFLNQPDHLLCVWNWLVHPLLFLKSLLILWRAATSIVLQLYLMLLQGVSSLLRVCR